MTIEEAIERYEDMGFTFISPIPILRKLMLILQVEKSKTQ